MRLTIEGFEGQIEETVLSKKSMVEYKSSANPQNVSIPKLHGTDVGNVDLYPHGAMSTRSGLQKVSSTPWLSSAIIKQYQWESSGDTPTNYLLAFSCLSGAASAAIATMTMTGGSIIFTNKPISPARAWAPGISDVIDITSFAGSAIFTYKSSLSLISFNGGDTCQPVTQSPSGARCAGAWGNYLFVGNILNSAGTVRYGSRIQWCQAGNIGNWPADYYVDLDVDDGDEITGIWILGDNIVVFKKYKTFVGRWVGGTLLFEFKRRDLIGCVGPQATIEVEGALYYLSHNGFRVFDGFSPSESLSTSIYTSTTEINVDYQQISDATYAPALDQILFSVPHSTSTIKNRIYVFDRTLKSWTKYSVSMASMVTTRYGNILTYFGNYAGYIYEFSTTALDDAAAIAGYWESPWIDLTIPDRNKRITSATIMMDTISGSAALHLDIYTDWDDTTAKKQLTCALSGGPDTAEKRLDFTVPCRVFKFKVYTNELNAKFTIHQIIFLILTKGAILVS